MSTPISSVGVQARTFGVPGACPCLNAFSSRSRAWRSSPPVCSAATVRRGVPTAIEPAVVRARLASDWLVPPWAAVAQTRRVVPYRDAVRRRGMPVSANAASQHRAVAVRNVVHDDRGWLQPVDRVALRALVRGDHVLFCEECQHEAGEVARVLQRKSERPGGPVRGPHRAATSALERVERRAVRVDEEGRRALATRECRQPVRTSTPDEVTTSFLLHVALEPRMEDRPLESCALEKASQVHLGSSKPSASGITRSVRPGRRGLRARGRRGDRCHRPAPPRPALP